MLLNCMIIQVPSMAMEELLIILEFIELKRRTSHQTDSLYLNTSLKLFFLKKCEFDNSILLVIKIIFYKLYPIQFNHSSSSSYSFGHFQLPLFSDSRIISCILCLISSKGHLFMISNKIELFILFFENFRTSWR